jgi:hypothetical protein
MRHEHGSIGIGEEDHVAGAGVEVAAHDRHATGFGVPARGPQASKCCVDDDAVADRDGVPRAELDGVSRAAHLVEQSF